MGKHLLVIDDETMILDAIKIIFEDLGHSVVTFSDPVAGVEEASRGIYDLILVDIRMPGMNGAEVTRRVRAVKPDARVLIVTAFPYDPLVVKAREAGAFALLKKPFEIAAVLDLLKES